MPLYVKCLAPAGRVVSPTPLLRRSSSPPLYSTSLHAPPPLSTPPKSSSASPRFTLYHILLSWSKKQRQNLACGERKDNSQGTSLFLQEIRVKYCRNADEPRPNVRRDGNSFIHELPETQAHNCRQGELPATGCRDENFTGNLETAWGKEELSGIAIKCVPAEELGFLQSHLC